MTSIFDDSGMNFRQSSCQCRWVRHVYSVDCNSYSYKESRLFKVPQLSIEEDVSSVPLSFYLLNFCKNAMDSNVHTRHQFFTVASLSIFRPKKLE